MKTERLQTKKCEQDWIGLRRRRVNKGKRMRFLMKIEEIPGSASVDAWFDTEQAAIVMSERVGDHYDFDQILR